MFEKKEAARPGGTSSAKVIEVILTETVVGTGVPEDPVRKIQEYWTLEGERIVILDPVVPC